MKSLELLLDMHCGEYDDGPDKARIVIDEKLFRRIKELQRNVKRLKVHAIRDWDYTPEFLSDDYDNTDDEGNPGHKEYEVSIDCLTLDVTSEDFWWHGCFKHSNGSIETSMVSIEDTDECFKVLRCKREKLPLLMGTLKTEKAQQLYEKRLKGEKE